MDLAPIIYSLAAMASGCAAVLAWVAKIRWAKEYREAKEVQIEALRTTIDGLKQLSSQVAFGAAEAVEKSAAKHIQILKDENSALQAELDKVKDDNRSAEQRLNGIRNFLAERQRQIEEEVNRIQVNAAFILPPVHWNAEGTVRPQGGEGKSNAEVIED